MSLIGEDCCGQGYVVAVLRFCALGRAWTAIRDFIFFDQWDGGTLCPRGTNGNKVLVMRLNFRRCRGVRLVWSMGPHFRGVQNRAKAGSVMYSHMDSRWHRTSLGIKMK